jgi:hypothetical protein
MDEDLAMTTQQVRTTLRANSFQPLTIRMADDRQFSDSAS